MHFLTELHNSDNDLHLNNKKDFQSFKYISVVLSKVLPSEFEPPNNDAEDELISN